MTPAVGDARLTHALQLLHRDTGVKDVSARRLSAGLIQQRHAELALIQQVVDTFSDEPSARALSPLVYDPHTKLFVLFGGDHLDYVMNDLWVFDPKALRWEQRHPPQSPAPRANHQW